MAARSVLRVAGLALVAILALAAIVLWRAWRLESRQPAPGTPVAIPLDDGKAALRLGAAIRIPTVTLGDGAPASLDVFGAMHEHLAASFPRVHAFFTREVIPGGSLLFSSPPVAGPPPLIFTGHMDVVPVSESSLALWTHPPFGGVIAADAIWGRGTIDDKISVMGVLEAMEALLASGFQPTRTIYLAFGHDEEAGGLAGAREIAARLHARGVRNAWLLDEGGLIYDELPGVTAPVALIGIGEKGYLSLELRVTTAGGHSSMPPAETAIGILARALDRVERRPLPARFDGPARQTFEWLAPEMALGMRAVFANVWLFRPLIIRQLSGAPATNAAVRTTTAPTLLEGSPKDNVLAAVARAVVNFRLAPGDSVDDIERHVKRAVGDDRVAVARYGTVASEATATAPTDTPEFDALAEAVRGANPGVLVAPYLTLGATDARHYAAVASAAYRFVPVHQPGAAAMAHGTNEHVGVAAYGRTIRTYAAIIARLAGK